MKTCIALCVALAVLAGCNTVKGFGRDVEKVGEKMQGSADRKK